MHRQVAKKSGEPVLVLQSRRFPGGKYIADDLLYVYPGAKLMLLENSINSHLVNGSLGYYRGAYFSSKDLSKTPPNYLSPVCLFIEFPYTKFTSNLSNQVIPIFPTKELQDFAGGSSRVSKFPLIGASSVTCLKFQGQTTNKVKIKLEKNI